MSAAPEFVSLDLRDDVPTEICPSCAAGGLLHQPTKTLICHCHHNKRGAYSVGGRDWKVVESASLAEFRAGISLGIVKAEADAMQEGGARN